MNVVLIDPVLINITLQKHFITIKYPATKHWSFLWHVTHTDWHHSYWPITSLHLHYIRSCWFWPQDPPQTTDPDTRIVEFSPNSKSLDCGWRWRRRVSIALWWAFLCWSWCPAEAAVHAADSRKRQLPLTTRLLVWTTLVIKIPSVSLVHGVWQTASHPPSINSSLHTEASASFSLFNNVKKNTVWTHSHRWSSHLWITSIKSAHLSGCR